MAERKDREGAIVFVNINDMERLLYIATDISMAEHYPFGLTCGTRSEDQLREVISLYLRQQALVKRLYWQVFNINQRDWGLFETSILFCGSDQPLCLGCVSNLDQKI